jgi:hypothetical protein
MNPSLVIVTNYGRINRWRQAILLIDKEQACPQKNVWANRKWVIDNPLKRYIIVSDKTSY